MIGWSELWRKKETYNCLKDSGCVMYGTRSKRNILLLCLDYGRVCINRILTVCNSTRLEPNPDWGNVYKEQELTQSATCKDFLQVQIEGGKEKRRLTKFYNLDVIISVGYRVKSKRGTQFRQWATKVLNQYIRQGYAVSNRFEKLEQRMTNVENQIESFVHAALPPKEGIFADGQIYDAYEFIERLIKSAKKTIVLIDNYVDESVLTMLSGKNKGVQVDIYTKELSNALLLAQDKFNSQ